MPLIEFVPLGVYYLYGFIASWRMLLRNDLQFIKNWNGFAGYAAVDAFFALFIGVVYPLHIGFIAVTSRIESDPAEAAKKFAGRSREEKLADKATELDRRERKIKELEKECLS